MLAAVLMVWSRSLHFSKGVLVLRGMWGVARAMGMVQFGSFAELQQCRAGLFEVYVFLWHSLGVFSLVCGRNPHHLQLAARQRHGAVAPAAEGPWLVLGLLQASCLMGSNCLHSSCGSDGGWHRNRICRCSAAGRFVGVRGECPSALQVLAVLQLHDLSATCGFPRALCNTICEHMAGRDSYDYAAGYTRGKGQQCGCGSPAAGPAGM